MFIVFNQHNIFDPKGGSAAYRSDNAIVKPGCSYYTFI